MGKKKTEKWAVDALQPLQHHPFATLGKQLGVASRTDEPATVSGPAADAPLPSPQPQATLLVRREKRKKGKTVTCIYHLTGEVETLARTLRQKLATGGNVEDGVVNLQGDHCDRVATLLRDQGFKVRQG